MMRIRNIIFPPKLDLPLKKVQKRQIKRKQENEARPKEDTPQLTLSKVCNLPWGRYFWLGIEWSVQITGCSESWRFTGFLAHVTAWSFHISTKMPPRCFGEEKDPRGIWPGLLSLLLTSVWPRAVAWFLWAILLQNGNNNHNNRGIVKSNDHAIKKKIHFLFTSPHCPHSLLCSYILDYFLFPKYTRLSHSFALAFLFSFSRMHPSTYSFAW